MDDLDKEFKQDFLTEAKELLDSTERSFLELEQRPDDSSLINNIFRFGIICICTMALRVRSRNKSPKASGWCATW